MVVEAGMTVAITRLEHTAALRCHATRSADAPVARRLLALALILDGHKRADAARSAGMDRQTLRDWVHRYTRTALRAWATGMVGEHQEVWGASNEETTNSSAVEYSLARSDATPHTS